MIEWFFSRVSDFVFQMVPTWAWLVLGALVVAVIVGVGWRFYKVVGWQGIAAGVGAFLAGLGAFFTYRAGYRAGRANTPPVVPLHEEHEDPISPAPRPRRTLRDLFKK